MPGKRTPSARSARADRKHVVAGPGELACGAKPKGKRTECDRPAGFGTDHPGVGCCVLHGGNTSVQIGSGKVARAELSMLTDENVTFMDPAQALLWCVTLAAQDVRWLNSQIADLNSATIRPQTTERGYSAEKGQHNSRKWEARRLDGFILERFRAEERLARYSKMALDAGVAERMVRLAERMGDVLAPAIASILEELGLSASQKKRAPDIVRTALTAIEGQAIAA